MSLDGLHRLRPGGYSPIPLPFRAVPRYAPLQDTQWAFDAWIGTESPLTYDEFLTHHWTNMPAIPLGGTGET